MLNQETLNKLRHMKLTGMVGALEQQENDPSYRGMNFQQRLGLLVDCEFTRRWDKPPVASQYEPAEWLEQIPIPVAAGAITDWLSAKAYKIIIKGSRSMRLPS